MFKKRALTLIIGAALVGALALSFTDCSGKKPAEEAGGGNEMTVTFQNGVAQGVYKDDPSWNYDGEGSGPQDVPPPPDLGEWTPTVDGFFFFGGVYLTAAANADRDGRILYAPLSSDRTSIGKWTAADTPFPKRKDYRITQIVRGDDTCVASGYQYAGPDSPPSDSVVAYTEDGINWKTANCPLPGNTQISGIASGNGRLVMIARSYSEVPDEGRYQSTERIAVSTDGVNWTLLTNDFTDTTDTRITFRSITYDWDLTKEESKFIIESQMWVPAEWGGWTSKENDIGTMVSTDGINWTKSWELSE